MFRDLKADEISVRVQSIYKNKALLLIYKDARVDMSILNEVYGVGNWKREHRIEGEYLICRVSVYNKDIKEWAYYEDVGIEGNYQKEKSLFSDAFKRACFNLGIGIELYTAPKLVVTLTDEEVQYQNKINFHVSDLITINKTIMGITIRDASGTNRLRIPYNEQQLRTKGELKNVKMDNQKRSLKQDESL